MDIRTILTIVVIAVGLGGWGARMEFQQQADIQHKKEACLKWCVDSCQRSCETNGVPIENCSCDYCYRECSY